MPALVRLCAAERIVEGLPLAVEVPGWPPLAVFRVGDGYHATRNQCTHGRARLTDGHQAGATIVCPLHAGAFDIASGAAVALPCEVPLRTYAVERHGDTLFLRPPASP